MIEYILQGLSHYIYLLLNMLDFKDNGFILIVIVGMLLICIKDKIVYKSMISVIKSMYNVSKTKVGFIIVCLVCSYYIYILVCFENQYNILLIVFTIYLFIQDILRINLILLPESKFKLVDLLKDITIPILLLFVSESVTMIEKRNFDNINFAVYSLVFIPIFMILIIVFRHFIFCEDTYNIYKKRIKIDDYEFFKITTKVSIKCKDYKIARLVLEEFFIENYNLNYNEMKLKLRDHTNNAMKEYNKKEFTQGKKQKYEKSKISKLFEVIWIANIICIIYTVIDNRFCGGSYDFSYYWSIVVLNIYFWCDLMKKRNIQNQYDFVVCMFINIMLIVMLICYYIGLDRTRLSEILFYVPIFVIMHLKTYNKKFPNIINMPFLTKDNFFGLNPSKYNKKMNGR